MLFNFRVTPLEQIEPWGRDNDLVLHWFALTYGCNWLRAGETELFRYREEVLEHFHDFYQCKPYVDYPIVRLWEDLLEILPSVMTPVPQSLAKVLAAPDLDSWRTRVERWMDSTEDGLDDPTYDYATEWVRKRHLQSGHLVAGPRIWLWNDGTHIHLEGIIVAV